MNYANPMPLYPLHMFPPKLWQALNLVQMQIQSSPAMVGTMAIGVMSEAVQGLADVQIPQGPLCTLSTWVLAIADSGGGKTPTMNMLRIRSVVAFEAGKYQAYAAQLEQYEIDHLAWKLELDELSNALRKAVRKKQDTSELKLHLATHMLAKPKKPRRIKLSCPDPTVEALLHGMAKFWPNVALPIDEASLFFNGHMADGLASLNQCWDGQSLSIDRRSLDEPITVDAPRVTLNLGIQPDLLGKYFKRRGNEGRSLGALPRMLICCPENNQGFRNVTPIALDLQHLDAFHQRVQALLAQSIAEDGEPIAQKRVIEFSPEAATRFHELRGQIECDIRPGGWLEPVSDYAAKAARHVAKLAATFELFENDNGVISLDMLERAISLIHWYVAEYRRLFTSPPEMPQEVKDADTLYPWLCQFATRRCNRYLMKNDVLKHAPNCMRSKPRLEQVLQVLWQRGQVGLWQLGKVGYIDLSPLQPYDPTSLQTALNSYRAKRSQTPSPA